MIRLAQLYTGAVGSEVVRRCAGHSKFDLVAVMVHSERKSGRDSGQLVGSAPNGVIATTRVEEIIASRPDAAIHSGMVFDIDLITTLLRAGINVYTGIGGFYLPGSADFLVIDAAARQGGASFTAGGNIPGLISDVFPLFLTGYTGRIRQIRASQRNDVSSYPSAAQVQSLGIGTDSGVFEAGAALIDPYITGAILQSAHMVADGIGVTCTDCALVAKRVALAVKPITMPRSGLAIAPGQVAGIEWSWSATASGREFLRISNQQTAALNLGEGWRTTYEEPPWRVEIDGEPSIVATFGWPDGAPSGESTQLLNVSRAMNTIPRLVAAQPGAVSVLDMLAPVAADGVGR